MRDRRIGVTIDLHMEADISERWYSEDLFRQSVESAEQQGRSTCEKGAACCMALTVENFHVEEPRAGGYMPKSATVSGICTSEECPDKPGLAMDTVFGFAGYDSRVRVGHASPIFEDSETARRILSLVEQQ